MNSYLERRNNRNGDTLGCDDLPIRGQPARSVETLAIKQRHAIAGNGRHFFDGCALSIMRQHIE